MLLEVTDQSFETLVANKGLVIVDFWSPWCSPCNMLTPVMKRLAENNNDVQIGKLNCSEQHAVAQRFRIQAIPTILFFKDGKLVKNLLGYHSEGQLQNYINELK